MLILIDNHLLTKRMSAKMMFINHLFLFHCFRICYNNILSFDKRCIFYISCHLDFHSLFDFNMAVIKCICGLILFEFAYFYTSFVKTWISFVINHQTCHKTENLKTIFINWYWKIWNIFQCFYIYHYIVFYLCLTKSRYLVDT